MSNTTTTIKADTAQIASSAKKLEEYIELYVEVYGQIEQLARDLDATWDGEDNDKYNEQLGEFHGDFVDLKNKLDQYVQFLKDAATAYNTAQEDLEKTAGTLATDR